MVSPEPPGQGTPDQWRPSAALLSLVLWLAEFLYGDERSSPSPQRSAKSSKLRLASVWRRFGAMLIDACIIFWPLRQLATMVFDGTRVPDGWGKLLGLVGWSGLAWIGLLVAYIVGLEWRFGCTLGKLALGIRVRRIDGTPIRLHQALARFFVLPVDLAGFGLFGMLLVLVGPYKQRYGDHIARTFVVKVAHRPLVSKWYQPMRVPYA